MNRKQIVLAVAVAAGVTLMLDLLVNVVAGDLQAYFATRRGLLYGGLAVIFLLSLVMTIYLLRLQAAPEASVRIRERVQKSRVTNSPIQVQAEQADIERDVSDDSVVEDSGITVD